MKALSRAELARRLDHTLVGPQATKSDLARLCAEARENGFHGVCVHGSRVEHAYALLEDTDVKVISLVGFPFGASDADVKRYETEVAIDHGAQEIEMVLNLGRLKDGDAAYVLRELRDIAEAADERPVTLILETSLLTPKERDLACELALDSGVQFVSTGTGLSAAATVADVKSLRSSVGEKFGVKAAGWITDASTAMTLIEAGATRVGATDGMAVLSGLPKHKPS
jgi:deoxyribose-phosphate aldolase